jgi:hypothetical protein
MLREKLWKMHKSYVRNTAAEAIVFEEKVCVGKLAIQAVEALNIPARETYITTRCLKHLYDKKPAEEFDFVINHIAKILQNPDYLYLNKQDKRGHFCLTKKIFNNEYFMSLETIFEKECQEIYIATAFRIRDSKYLKSYDLLRSWRDGAHSSPRVDTDIHRINDAPQ